MPHSLKLLDGTATPDPLARVHVWFKRFRPSKVMAMALSIAAISSGAATWVAMTSSETPLGASSQTLKVLTIVNLVLLVTLFTVIGRRIYGLWHAMKQGAVGSRLQTRIVLIFSLVTIIPTLIVSTFSALLFHFGIQAWFDERVQTALEESVAVAEIYLAEHKETIRADALAMAGDLRRDLPVLMTNPTLFNQVLDGQTALRNLSEAVVFTRGGALARTSLSFSRTMERRPEHVRARADFGQIIGVADEDDKIRAVLKLDSATDVYLMIGRSVDERVMNHMIAAHGAVNKYRTLKSDISNIQIHFSLLFILVSLLLLLSAIWYGIYIAINLVIPVTRLISAAEKVRAGDYQARVPVGSKEDELNTLARTFNRMTEQLDRQRAELMTANRQLDERRRFTEAIFAGVSAGVVALDAFLVITLNNRTAASLLQNDERQSMKGMPITALIPDSAALLEKVRHNPNVMADQHLTIRRGDKKLNLHVRVSAEVKGEEIEGYIVTFDDITELVAAQRSAAWSDVAKRIAHEIKNPLTPIALSADRLRRKYADFLPEGEDRDNFQRYLDTIGRHVKDIGQMVEEFVSFARMPAAVMAQHDLNQTIRDACFSARTAHPTVHYTYLLPPTPVIMRCDERQMAQVFINLLKNAAEGIESRTEQSTDSPDGEVQIRVEASEKLIIVTIEDNGLGFPPDKIHQLTEPYVTTRAKGTGLGLAIVKKHIESHRGTLELENRREGGARVILRFTVA